MARHRTYRRRQVQARPRCPHTGQFLPFYDTPGDGLGRYGRRKKTAPPRRRKAVAKPVRRRRKVIAAPVRRRARAVRRRRAVAHTPWWSKPANRRNKGSSSASLKNLRASFRKKHGDDWFENTKVKAAYDKRKAKLKK
jgi:hypothetical protein